MTSTEIERAINVIDNVNAGKMIVPLDQAQHRAMLEVAYQLALLNEGMNYLTETQNPRLHVMVEPGNYPIQVQEQKR